MEKGIFLAAVLGVILIIGINDAIVDSAEGSGSVIYVPDDYSTIQTAIDAATDGDIIIVRDGIYSENVNVNKKLTIMSENGPSNCVIQASDSNSPVFTVTASYVNISGFTIRGATYSCGILLNGIQHCNISDNIVSNSEEGIYLYSSSYNNISHNTISSNTNMGLYFFQSSNNIVAHNTISNNRDGINIGSYSTNTIYKNTISGNSQYGIYVDYYSPNNIIYLNNIIGNGYNANPWSSNTWSSPFTITYTYNGNEYTNYMGNYWSDYAGSDDDNDGIGDTPYNIPSTDYYDYYPLMQQWENYFANYGIVNLNTGENFENIQDAIAAASNGDTIKVYPGTYDGPVIINKEIKLIGDPAIDAHGGIGIRIEANNTLVENFTIYNFSTGILAHNDSFTLHNVTINNCTIYNFTGTGTGINFDNVIQSTINNTNVNDTEDAILFSTSHNNTISNCNISNNDNGILLDHSHNNAISNCNIFSSFYEGIGLFSSYNDTIFNCNISNNGDGIYASHSSNNTISNCNISSNNMDGIELSSSSNNTISNCNISSNNWHGISAYAFHNNTISNSTISSNNDNGVFFRSSYNNTIFNCNISSNGWHGIELYVSYNNTISNCNISSNNWNGVYAYSSSNNIIYTCNVSLNNWSGIVLETFFSYSNTISNCNISSNDWHGIELDMSDSNTISNCNIHSNNQYGIYAYSSYSNTISNCNISYSSYGIYYQYSNFNTISNCNITRNSKRAVYLDHCNNNTFIGDNVSRNTRYGFYVSHSENISLINNNISQNGHVGPYEGVFFEYSNYNTLTNNTVMHNGRIGIYIAHGNHNTLIGNNVSYNLHGILMYRGYYNLLQCNTASHNSGSYGIEFVGGGHNEILDNTANWNGEYGIVLAPYYGSYSEHNVLINNTARFNGYGIYLSTARYNTISRCNVTDNACGIYLINSPNNEIVYSYIARNAGDTGIFIGEGSNHTSIEGNTICNNDIGIYVYGGIAESYENTDTEIRWNKIYGNSNYGLIYDIGIGVTPYINATYNFWGNGNGPSNANMIDPLTGEWANGTGDAIGGGIANDNIHFDPWIGKLILYEGWNTITIPVWNESIATAEDLGEYINSVAGSNVCVIISKWDTSKQRYVSHVVGYGGKGFTLKPGEGYFIYMEQDLNVSINGTIVEPAVDIILSSGYNFIGWTKVIPTTAEDLGSNISYCTKIARWNASSQQWMAEYSVAFNLPENFYIIAGDGIFVYRTEGTEHWQG